jgi:hypothetical protein
MPRLVLSAVLASAPSAAGAHPSQQHKPARHMLHHMPHHLLTIPGACAITCAITCSPSLEPAPSQRLPNLAMATAAHAIASFWPMPGYMHYAYMLLHAGAARAQPFLPCTLTMQPTTMMLMMPAMMPDHRQAGRWVITGRWLPTLAVLRHGHLWLRLMLSLASALAVRQRQLLIQAADLCSDGLPAQLLEGEDGRQHVALLVASGWHQLACRAAGRRCQRDEALAAWASSWPLLGRMRCWPAGRAGSSSGRWWCIVRLEHRGTSRDIRASEQSISALQHQVQSKELSIRACSKAGDGRQPYQMSQRRTRPG